MMLETTFPSATNSTGAGEGMTPELCGGVSRGRLGALIRVPGNELKAPDAVQADGSRTME